MDASQIRIKRIERIADLQLEKCGFNGVTSIIAVPKEKNPLGAVPDVVGCKSPEEKSRALGIVRDICQRELDREAPKDLPRDLKDRLLTD